MKNKQRGISLSGLLFWGVIIIFGGILAAKTVPEYIVYYKILKATKATAVHAGEKDLAELRNDFWKRIYVDHITVMTEQDLSITKESGVTVFAFDYEKRVPLFYNISLLLDFKGRATAP